jgi:hypothetical protein
MKAGIAMKLASCRENEKFLVLLRVAGGSFAVNLFPSV